MIIDDLFKGHHTPKKLQQGDFSMNDLKLHFKNIKRMRLIRKYGEVGLKEIFYTKTFVR
jgi:hypothetical protein